MEPCSNFGLVIFFFFPDWLARVGEAGIPRWKRVWIAFRVPRIVTKTRVAGDSEQARHAVQLCFAWRSGDLADVTGQPPRPHSGGAQKGAWLMSKHLYLAMVPFVGHEGVVS